MDRPKRSPRGAERSEGGPYVPQKTPQAPRGVLQCVPAKEAVELVRAADNGK